MNPGSHPWTKADSDFARQQEFVFSILNLIVIATLLLANLLLARFWGEVTLYLFSVLSIGFLGHTFLLAWIQAGPPILKSRGMSVITIASIALNTLLTVAASATNKYDSQYYVLMSVPVLQAAFRFSLPVTIGVAALADFLNFFWIWQYSRLHGPVDVDEYIEAGTISFIYTVPGVVVWVLVARLRRRENSLAENISELHRTRERLTKEEKLAAIGRLSSAIAHEIRNPVAMIASSLSMAERANLPVAEREEMFKIAVKESSRLEDLTADFLTYARPRPAKKTLANASDTLHYIASTCHAYAAAKNVSLKVESPGKLMAPIHESQIHQALLNLVRNAIDASPEGACVYLRGASRKDDEVTLEVENPGPAIPEDAVSRLFEPFFTTKASGNGLGLPITRNICRAHGGDLLLTENRDGRVCFTIELPLSNSLSVSQENPWDAS